MNNLIRHSYNGAIISQDVDGYVSLTDMAKAHNKLVADYLRNSTTKAYIEELSVDMRIPISALVKVFKGGSGKQGTWAHPEIAIDFAQWCSPKFKVWANRTLRNVIATQQAPSVLPPFWYQRLMLDLKTNPVPNGYFSIGS